MPTLKRLSFYIAAPAMLFIAAGAVAGSPGGSYAGLAATAENVNVKYDKRLINRGVHNGAEEHKIMRGAGAFIGYRMPLTEGGVYLSGELDWMHHGGTARGRLTGAQGPSVPASPSMVGYEDAWPERWRVEKEESYGLTLKLGMPVSSAWMGPGASVYALAGVRRMKWDFSTNLAGCEHTNPACDPADPDPAEFHHYLEEHDRTTTAWTWGAGLEKMIGETTALRGEISYSEYERVSHPTRYTVTPVPPEFIVPRDLDGNAVGLSLGLVQYF